MKALSIVLLTFILVCVAPFSANAKDEDSQENFRRLSITISPVHLLLPVAEITGEYMVSSQLGLAAVGGGGQITVKDNVIGDTKFDLFELGGQARYYPFRSFPHGFQVGGEVLWMNISGDFSKVDATGTGAGTAIGPFVGYKYTAPFGLVFDSQFGTEYLMIQASAASGSTSVSKTKNKWIPLLNLNVGWAF